MSSNTIFYGHGLPVIPKHQLFEREIIKNEEELQEITSKIDEEILLLRVFDLDTMSYCGYHIISQKHALRALGAELNANMMLRKQVKDLTQELNNIKQMGMWEFESKYCNSEDLEEAGHQLARDLLGK